MMESATSTETEGSSNKTTINEIRTERLSKALQKMRKKSLSMCGMRDISKINIKVDPPAENSPKKFVGTSAIDHQSTFKEDDATFLRVRTGSVPANSLELAVKSLAHARKAGVEGVAAAAKRIASGGGSGIGGSQQQQQQQTGANSLNRFVKQLLHRREKECDQWPSCGYHSPTKKAVGIQQQQSASSPSGFNIRSVIYNNQRGTGSCSKNSSNASSRCQSPISGYLTFINLAAASADTMAQTIGVDIHTVLVIGSEGVGKGELIEMFQRVNLNRIPDDLEYEDGNGLITFITDNKETRLRFIEVNNEKNDLWQSLSADCYVVVYKSDNSWSFRNGVQIVAKIRDCSGSVPVFIILNKVHSSFEATSRPPPTAGEDGRQIAKQSNCTFFELCVIGFSTCSAENMLVSIIRQIRSYAHRQNRSPCVTTRGRGQSIESTGDSRTGPFDQQQQQQNRIAGHGGNSNSCFFQFRTYSIDSNSSSASSSKTSPSHTNIMRRKLWHNNNKPTGQRAGAGCGADSTNLGVSLVSLTSMPSFQKYFKFIRRRKSLSLENLSIQRGWTKKNMYK